MPDEPRDPAAPPRRITDRDGCFFYHTMDLPGVGTVPGEWDLRGGEDAYLGGIDVAGKRVLDVGVASGALAFWMESRGAQVVGLDLPQTGPMDRVTFAGEDVAAQVAAEHAMVGALRTGFWFAHTAIGSDVQLVESSAYDMPEGVGRFDIGVIGSILLHLRDPWAALAETAAHVDETIVVAETIWPRNLLGYLTRRALRIPNRAPVFVPRARRGGPVHTWWFLPAPFIQEALTILGFPHQTVTHHRQLFRGRRQLLYTVVARRESGGS
jgi:SAM-dependent methyltransferase